MFGVLWLLGATSFPGLFSFGLAETCLYAWRFHIKVTHSVRVLLSRTLLHSSHCTHLSTKPVFADLLRSPGIDSPSLAESIPRNRFLGSINVYSYGLRVRGNTSEKCWWIRFQKKFVRRIHFFGKFFSKFVSLSTTRKKTSLLLVFNVNIIIFIIFEATIISYMIWPGRINSSESIPGLHKRLQLWAQG
jgi:hypothetical protein